MHPLTLTPKEKAMTHQEYLDWQYYVAWCEGKQGRKVSIYEAIEVFKDDLYRVCMDKMGAGEDDLKDTLWKLKNFSSNKVDRERAKAYPIEQLVRELGHEPRMGFIKCPFHDDGSASLKIYKNTNTWHCFGCHEGSDSIDFMMKSTGANFIDSAKRLT